jgi:hypothetical protein
VLKGSKKIKELRARGEAKNQKNLHWCRRKCYLSAQKILLLIEEAPGLAGGCSIRVEQSPDRGLFIGLKEASLECGI